MSKRSASPIFVPFSYPYIVTNNFLLFCERGEGGEGLGAAGVEAVLIRHIDVLIFTSPLCTVFFRHTRHSILNRGFTFADDCGGNLFLNSLGADNIF